MEVFISIHQIIYAILFVCLTIIFGFGLFYRGQVGELWNYQKSVAYKQIGITLFEFDESIVNIQSGQINVTYELSQCKKIYTSYYGSFFILSFPNNQIIYIKLENENKEDIKRFSNLIRTFSKRRITKQTALGNILSPYLERDLNSKNRKIY